MVDLGMEVKQYSLMHHANDAINKRCRCCFTGLSRSFNEIPGD